MAVFFAKTLAVDSVFILDAMFVQYFIALCLYVCHMSVLSKWLNKSSLLLAQRLHWTFFTYKEMWVFLWKFVPNGVYLYGDVCPAVNISCIFASLGV